MRVLYVPPSSGNWLNHYGHSQRGFGFVGLPYQRGSGLGSLFSGLFRAILPLATSAAKTVGRQALVSGVDVASDVLAGKTINTAVKRRGKQAGRRLLKKASRKLKQTGTGRKRRRGYKRRYRRRRKRQIGRGLGKRPAGISFGSRSRRRTVKRRRRRRTDALGTYYG